MNGLILVESSSLLWLCLVMWYRGGCFDILMFVLFCFVVRLLMLCTFSYHLYEPAVILDEI